MPTEAHAAPAPAEATTAPSERPAGIQDRFKRWAQTLPERNGGRIGVIALVLILALGLGLRINQALNPADLGDVGVDAATYQRMAEELYEEGHFGLPGQTSPLDWSPGTVFLYAGVYAVTGGVHPEAARLFVALLGMLSVLFVYLIGRRLAGPLAGLVGGGLVAIYPVFLVNNARLMSEPPAIAALTGAVLAFLWAGDRRNAWAWALPGALLGLTAFARPEYLMIALLLGVLALIRTGRDRCWKSGFASAAAFITAFALMLAPWTIRNLIVEDRFIPVSTGGGKALFVGTYLPADGIYIEVKRHLIHRYYGQSGLTREGVERVNPTPLFDRVASKYPELEPDAALAKVGRENLRRYLSKDPFGVAGMVLYKMGYMWQPADDGLRTATYTAILHYAILVFGAAGLVILAWRRRWEALVLGVVILGITVIGGLLLAGVRRNLLLMPFVMACAGVAVSALVTWARQARP
jgi:4-amino-4-deoxy-L-arabinose transferase-like glycosyltransferase